MDRTLITLLILSLVLLAWQAPYAMMTMLGILALSILFVRITWGFLQGDGARAPEAERVWTKR